jgi:hypothetical protein
LGKLAESLLLEARQQVKLAESLPCGPAAIRESPYFPWRGDPSIDANVKARGSSRSSGLFAPDTENGPSKWIHAPSALFRRIYRGST